jgi:K+-sensing histidine kinase KdpD
MSGVSEGSRELLIRTGKDGSSGLLVAVQDSGPGLNAESFDRLFDAFYFQLNHSLQVDTAISLGPGIERVRLRVRSRTPTINLCGFQLAGVC